MSSVERPRPLAIELTFDADSDERLRRAWRRLAGLHEGRTTAELGVNPHVTLAVFRNEEPSDLTDVVTTLATKVMAFELDLASVGCFGTSEGVVYLQPAASQELQRAHALLDDLLGQQRTKVDAYYRPTAWQPHCTMALAVPTSSLEAVMAACNGDDVKGPVQVQDVRLTRYRPATEIQRATLATTH